MGESIKNLLLEAEEALEKLESLALKQSMRQMWKINAHFSESNTELFSIYNSKLNHFFVLADSEDHALDMLVNLGHIINRKLARISKADPRAWVPEMSKFFSSAARAAASKAQGIVTNSNGFAVMKRSGAIYMPLSVVPE